MEFFGSYLKYNLMTTFRLGESTEPAMFVTIVAKQHEQLVRAIAFGGLHIARASSWLDEITKKLVEHFN